MMLNDDADTPSQKPHTFFTPDKVVAIYTILSILQKMKVRVGLEAMLAYMDQYCLTIEKNNPQFQLAVKEALTLMDVRKMYRDACCREEN